MCARKVHDIKRSQKESHLHRVIANLFLSIAQDDPSVQGLSINRVKLSQDKGICYVLFYSVKGRKDFDEKLSQLVLYKPSIRTALSSLLASRYVPEIVFQYDDQFAKQEAIERLLDTLKPEDHS
jgi:ribosome-binding factor A